MTIHPLLYTYTYTYGIGLSINHKYMENEQNREAILTNFKKAHSHLSKVIAMVRDGTYCIDIMQQNLAVIGLLKSAHQMLMKNHINSCFLKAVNTGSQGTRNRMVEEIFHVIKLSNK